MSGWSMAEEAALGSDADGESSPEEDEPPDTSSGEPDKTSSEDTTENSTAPEEDGSDKESEDGPDELIDEISDSLSDEGFGVFHGREFVSLREDGQLAPNSTVSQQYLDGKEAVILAYNENSNEIAIIPLDKDYDRTDVYSLQWSEDRVSVSASGFLKDNDIKTDKTMRYSPEWDDDIGNSNVPGGLLIDLDQDGEVSPTSHDTPAEESD